MIFVTMVILLLHSVAIKNKNIVWQLKCHLIVADQNAYIEIVQAALPCMYAFIAEHLAFNSFP